MMDTLKDIWDEAWEFFLYTLPLLITTTIILFIVLLGISLWYLFTGMNKEHDDFMKECIQYKKEYECTYMWRSSRQDTVPVFIPIPTGR